MAGPFEFRQNPNKQLMTHHNILFQKIDNQRRLIITLVILFCGRELHDPCPTRFDALASIERVLCIIVVNYHSLLNIVYRTSYNAH